MAVGANLIKTFLDERSNNKIYGGKVRMFIVDFLNQNSGAFNLLFTAVVALATVVYAILTWKLVSETRMMRMVQTEPKISANLQPTEESIHFIEIIIQNIGLGPAYKVEFKVDPDFEDKDLKLKLSEVGFIKDGLYLFAPNQTLKFPLAFLFKDFKEKIEKSFKLTITYQNSIGSIYTDEYPIDFSQFRGLSQIGKPPLYEIAENIKLIQKDFSKISTGFNRLKIIRYTKEDIMEENKEFEKRFLEEKAQMKELLP